MFVFFRFHKGSKINVSPQHEVEIFIFYALESDALLRCCLLAKNHYLCDVDCLNDSQQRHIRKCFRTVLNGNLTVSRITGQRTALFILYGCMRGICCALCPYKVWGIASFNVIRVLSEPPLDKRNQASHFPFIITPPYQKPRGNKNY